MTEERLKSDDWERCEPGDVQRVVRGLKVRRRDRQIAKVIGIGGAGAMLVLVTLIAVAQFSGPSQHNYGNIACEEVRDNLPNYMAGGLDERLASRIRTHLSECPDCGPMYEKMSSQMSGTAQLHAAHSHHCQCGSCCRPATRAVASQTLLFAAAR